MYADCCNEVLLSPERLGRTGENPMRVDQRQENRMRHGVRLPHVGGGWKQVLEDQPDLRTPAGQNPQVVDQLEP